MLSSATICSTDRLACLGLVDVTADGSGPVARRLLLKSDERDFGAEVMVDSPLTPAKSESFGVELRPQAAVDGCMS